MFYSNQTPVDLVQTAIATVSATYDELDGTAFDQAVIEQCYLSAPGLSAPDHYYDCEQEFPCISHR